MADETVLQETTTEERTFTQTELNEIVGDRLARERKKYADYDELKGKAQQLEEVLAAQEAGNLERQKLQSQLDELIKANNLREMRQKVAKETGVPTDLLNGATEEECKTIAARILDFKKPSTYPTVKDGGEVLHKPTSSTTRDKFAEWAEKAFI